MAMNTYDKPPSRNTMTAGSVKPGKVPERTVSKPSTPAPSKGNAFTNGKLINGKC